MRGKRVRRWHLGHACSAVLLMLAIPSGTAAQVLRGVVVDGENEQVVPGALIRLLDVDNQVLAFSIADSTGMYSVSVPEPGEYRVAVEAYAYHPFRSLLLGVGDGRFYEIDVELSRAPLPLPGLMVTADRMEELERGLRLLIGVSPKSLRNAPILRPTIEEHIARAHNVTDLVRWSNLPGFTIMATSDGPCFRWRARGCVPVFLNGLPIAPDMVAVLSLEMLETILLLGPGETMVYGAGAVLLYTPGWIGQ
jgi:carboxypeptidase family protein